MKPISIVLSPTRSRPLNVFLGLLLTACRAPSAPLPRHLARLRSLAQHSLGRGLAPTQWRNWIGLFGAWLSDLLLQSLGLSALPAPHLAWRPRLDLDALPRPAARPGCAGPEPCSLSSSSPPSSACCPGTGAGSICSPSKASSAVLSRRSWSATSTSRAHGSSPACSPPPASTSPPPSASGPSKRPFRNAGSKSCPGTTATATGAKSGPSAKPSSRHSVRPSSTTSRRSTPPKPKNTPAASPTSSAATASASTTSTAPQLKTSPPSNAPP